MTRSANRSGSPTNAALWLAAGTAAGVLLGVALADKGGSRKMLQRLSGALRLVERFAGATGGRRVTGDDGRLADVPFDDELDGEDEDEIGFSDAVEHEGTGFEPDTADDHIDTRVLAAFEQDPILSQRDIEIDEPEPAVIALSGHVATARDAKHAATVARGVPGVERVENNIRLMR